MNRKTFKKCWNETLLYLYSPKTSNERKIQLCNHGLWLWSKRTETDYNTVYMRRHWTEVLTTGLEILKSKI
jgi:hypothetical protein